MHKLRILWYLMAGLVRGPLRTRDELDAWQRKRLRLFARRVLKRSPFYRRYVIDGEVDWSTIPVMTKTDYVEHFSEINTCGIDRDTAMALALEAERSRDFSATIRDITVGLSTGTSGKRSLFLVSPSERARWAARIVRRLLLRRLPRITRIAFFLRANSGLYESVGSVLFRFTFFDLTLPFDDLIKRVGALAPHVLAAPPSILVRLARAREQGALQLQPTIVVSFAEVLHDDDRRFIARVFGVEPVNVYQCTEGFIGMTCEHGTMHLQEDIMHVELEPVDATHVRPIITDFTRTSVPIVRYRMTDVLAMRTTACPCGSPLRAVERIVGRDDDVLLFYDEGGRVVPVYPDVLSRRIAVATDTFRAYRIRQDTSNTVRLQLDCDAPVYDETFATIERAIAAVCADQGIRGISIVEEPYAEIPSAVKTRRIQRTFNAMVEDKKQ